MFDELAAVLRDLAGIVSSLIVRDKKYSVENSIRIRAPKNDVWKKLWPEQGEPVQKRRDYNVEKVSGRDNLYKVSWGSNSLYPVSFLNIIEIREGEAFLAEKYFEDDDDSLAKQLIAVTLIESEDGHSTNVICYDLTPNLNMTDKLIISFEARWMLQMFRDFCEEDVAEADRAKELHVDEGEAFWAVMSSAAAFFGCWYFYDLSWAVLILMALVFHEFGHIMAMNFLGLHPSSAFILPFVGRAAMTRFPFRSELEHAFCSLMGPVVSLLPGSIFFFLYLWFGHVIPGAAAAIFAFVNLLSLLPVQPFGSERVINSVISSIRFEDVLAALVSAYITGIFAAAYHGYYILALLGALAFLLLYQPMYEILTELTSGMDEEHKPDSQGTSSIGMSSSGALAVLAGLAVCLFGHATILYITLSDTNVSTVLGH